MGKYRYSSPKIEKIVLGEWYACTINPSDKHQFYSIRDRLAKWHEHNTNVLDSILIPGVKVRLKAELSRGSRYHYHGWIKWKTEEALYSFYENCIHQLQGYCTYEFKEIDDWDGWYEYVVTTLH